MDISFNSEVRAYADRLVEARTADSVLVVLAQYITHYSNDEMADYLCISYEEFGDVIAKEKILSIEEKKLMVDMVLFGIKRFDSKFCSSN